MSNEPIPPAVPVAATEGSSGPTAPAPGSSGPASPPPGPTGPSGPTPPQAPPLLPLVALIFAVVSLCFPLFIPVAGLLAIIALVQLKGQDQSRAWMAITALAISFVAVVFVGIVASIAIPSFIKMQAKAKQSECKANLKSIAVAQRMSVEDEGEGMLTLQDLQNQGILEDEELLYTYVLGDPPQFDGDEANSVRGSVSKGHGAKPEDLIKRIPPLAGGVRPGAIGDCEHECDFTAVCIGQLDSDDDLDVWSIHTAARKAPDGSTIEAYQPYHEKDDAL